MATTYQIYVRDPFGNLLTVLTDFAALEFSRRECEVGAMAIELHPDTDRSLFLLDGIMEIWRTVDGYAPYLEGETGWLIRKQDFARTDAGEFRSRIVAYDYNHLLTRRIVAYDSNTIYSNKIGTADDIMKDLMSENYGSAVLDPARNLSAYIQIQAKQALGYAYNVDVSRRVLLDVFRELADASRQNGLYLTFDMVYLLPNKIEFRTYYGWRGNDRRSGTPNAIVLSTERGNLTSPQISYDHSSEASYIYCGGQGQTSLRITTTASDAARIALSPFNRVEAFVDSKNVDDIIKLQKDADMALRYMRGRRIFQGRVAEARGTQYGIDYGYGDYVTAEFDGFSFDCRIEGISVKFSDGMENIEAICKGEQLA